ncbi:hypothetical protein L6164_027218 [Bauhinia variegata]|uniref:Uncharacterized protein n=1 Tax=Bauhinia variegata TaxID=167791 RepID=A0ACB9LSH7_BAUVA|nr:hypothetical protein L6164_027218 [Bauhinia variegata]
MSWVHSEIHQRSGALTSHPVLSPSSSILPYDSHYQKQSSPHPVSSSSSKISPAVLFIIVILAVVFFISGLLHLLVRYLVKHRSSSISQSNRYPEMFESDAYQRQLQQLFHLHDSGLDQAFIDALPVFLYKEIIGLKEPFDCAVCLCEFSEEDNLRLLPMCNHAFHIDCIDTWLLSNSTCPLCRGTLYTPGFAFENPAFYFEDPREEDGVSGSAGGGACSVHKPAENDITVGKRVFSVRLGKFRSSNIGEGVERGEGESSNSKLDARRCYSMGSCQYVVAACDLQVSLSRSRVNGSTNSSFRQLKGRATHNGNSSIEGDAEGKNLNLARKGESFSVSKIWLWSKKDKLPICSETHMGNSTVTANSAWMITTRGT